MKSKIISFIKRKKIYRYIVAFGIFHGLVIFSRVRRSKKAIVSFKVPTLEHPVTLRRHTSDFVVFEEIFIDEIYKLSSLQPLKVIIDAGANIGLASLYFLFKYKPELLICIEPNEENYNILHSNLSNYSNVVFYKNALWNKNAYLRFKDSDAASWAYEVIETTEPEESTISAVSLNEVILEQSIQHIDLLKIDIEGSEKEVFESNTDWLYRIKYLIIEIHENMRAGAEKSVLDKTGNFELLSQVENNYLFAKIDAGLLQSDHLYS